MKPGKEIKYYGIHACLALAEQRPDAIVRVYLDASNLKLFRKLLKWCALQKIAYHIVPLEELARLTDTVHHEGICILAKENPALSEEAFFASLRSLPKKVCLLYLDGVENPHNVGSILRTAAHFGVPYILGDHLPALSGSCCRIAKGGAEAVRLVALRNPTQSLSRLCKEGFCLVATSSHQGEPLHQFPFPPRTILAIGSESKGVQPSLLKTASKRVRILGTGKMESLNVSVAAGLCMGVYSFQHQAER